MNAKGFSLVEIAMVMVIVGLTLGTMLPMLTAQQAQARITGTQSKMAIIKTALQTFVAQNGRLPCPADRTLPTTDPNYAREQALGPANINSVCTGSFNVGGGSFAARAYKGILPWRSLGLSDDVGLDAFSTPFTYQVSAGGVLVPIAGANTLHNFQSMYFMSGNQRVYTAFPFVNQPAAGANEITTAGQAVVVLVSHGADKLGAWYGGNQVPGAVGNQLQNANNDLLWLKGQFSSNTTNPFDDMVEFWTPAEMLAAAPDGAIKGAATAAGRLTAAADVFARCMAGGVAPCFPPAGQTPTGSGPACNNPVAVGTCTAGVGNQATMTLATFGTPSERAALVDIYGTPLCYRPVTPGTSAAPGTTICLVSAGPDRNFATAADNVVMTFNSAQLRALPSGSTLP